MEIVNKADVGVISLIIERGTQGKEYYEWSRPFNNAGVRCEGHVVNRIMLNDGVLYKRGNSFHSQLKDGLWGEFEEATDYELPVGNFLSS